MLCDRQSQMIGFSYTWKVENFLMNVYHVKELLVSPPFIVESLFHTKWSLGLYPKGKQSEKYISCYLNRLDDDGPQSVAAGFKISCVSANSQINSALKIDKEEFKKDSGAGRHNMWEWQTLLQKRGFYFPEDNFTIRCHLWACFTQKVMLNECTALTHIEVEKTSFRKSIQNFSALFSHHKVQFPIPLNSKFEITLYVTETSPDYVTVDVQRCGVTDNQRNLLVCRLSLLDENGIIKDFKEDKYLFELHQGNEVWKFPEFIKVQRLKQDNILFGDTLNLLFQFSFSSGKQTSRIVETKYVPPVEVGEDRISGIESLSQDFECLFLEKKFSDIKLRSGQELFPAHKAILCARSPVFAAMFESDMAENKSGLVDITDVDALTLKKLLIFIYSGIVENPEVEVIMKLFSAADKYQVINLKKKCTSFLKRNITVENSCQILLLADLHQEETLKKTAQEFICSHRHEILASEEWKCFTAQYVTLACEIVQKLSVRCLD